MPTPNRSIPFWKLQAIGNDFPLFHAEDLAGINLRDLAIAAADRKFGIGGDGILVMDKTETQDRVVLRMFNPDGTEDFCGNGLRIAARHAFDQGWVSSSFVIAHLHRDVPCEVDPNGAIRTTIGVADYTPQNVPVDSVHFLFDQEIGAFEDKRVRGSALTTGSTHTVIPVQDLPDDREISVLGPEIEYAPIFPDRTSVIFVKEIAPNELRIRIWERGVGETLGCGTGSSAAAADYLRRTNPVEDNHRILVHNPGGDIVISMRNWDTPITIEGVAETVYSGSFQLGES